MTDRIRRRGPGVVLLAVVAVTAVIGVSAVIYLWISAPATPSTVPYGQFLGEVGAGTVTRVTQQGTTLEVEGSGGAYQVTLPTVLTDTFGDIQQAATAANVMVPEFRAVPAPETSWVGVLVTVLLPVVLILVLIFVLIFMVRPARRERATGRSLSERLRALDEAHRSGLIPDDEWQRQRARVLDEA
jgi:uncharacterized membrane protein